MKYGKLRIAWSVVWGVLCLLLLALWVRSFWRTDLVSRINSQRIATTYGSQYGTVYFAHFDAGIGYRRSSNSSAPRPWAYESLTGYVANNGLFAWERHQTSIYVALPHWLVAVVATGIGASCWIPWRFSLRTLLIAATVVAVGLGMFVMMLKGS